MMGFNCGCGSVLRPVLGVMIFLALVLSAPAAVAAACTVDKVTVHNGGDVVPGDTVRVNVEWTNTGNDRKALVRCSTTQGSTLTRSIVLTKKKPQKAAVDFIIDWSADPGEYAVTVENTVDNTVYGPVDKAFTVKKAMEAVITAPTKAAPVTKSPGDKLTVAYAYKTNADTAVFIRLAEEKNHGPVVDSGKVGLKRAGASGSASVTVPSDAPFGEYTLTIVPAEDNVRILNTDMLPEKEAVILQPRLAITAPTRAAPASVRPGHSLAVDFSSEMPDTAAAVVRLLTGGGGAVASADVTLQRGKKSGRTTLTVPETTALGAYDLEIKTGTYAHLQKEAVTVEHRVTADLTAPKRSKPLSPTAGEKVTVEFKYTASEKTNIEVKIQEGGSEPLVKTSVPLEKTTGAKPKSVELTIPKDAAPGRYDVVLETPVSGKVLDSVREVIRVETVVTAAITAPTKAAPKTVRAGKRLRVDFEYTAAADTVVEVKMTDADDKVLASRTVYIDATETNKKRSATASVSIPSRTAAGEYDLKIFSKHGNEPLAEQEAAAHVDDPVALTLLSPTTADPVRRAAGNCTVRFRYRAEANSSVQFNIRPADGKPLVSRAVSLPKTTREETQTVTLNLTGALPTASYDLEAVNRNTGSVLAREANAIRPVSYPLDVQVRLVIGETGRWVNGQYQAVDMAPRIMENRTLLPIRHVGEPLGWRFNWDDQTKTATVVKGKKQVRVQVGSSEATVSEDNGLTWSTVRIDPENPSVQPVLITGRTLLPLRFVGETLDTRVDWDAAARAVTVTQT